MRARSTAADEMPTVGGPLVRADFDEMAAMEAACYGEELITPAEEAWRWYLAHPCTTVAAREQGVGLGGSGCSEGRARGGAYAAHGRAGSPACPTTAHAFDPRGDGRGDIVGPSDPTTARTSGTERAGGRDIAEHSSPIVARTPESPGTARGRIAGFVNLFPVRPAVFEALRAGTFNDADLVAGDVEPDLAQAGGMLLSCIVVDSTWRGRGLAYRLLATAAAQYPDAPAGMGIVVDTATPAGAGLARKLGFSPLGPSDHGTAVWQRDWAGFVRAVEALGRGGGQPAGQGSAASPE